MIGIVSGFLVSQILYHILITFFVYGQQLIPPSTLAIARDGIWIIICLAFFLLHIKEWKNYFKQWGKVWLGFGGLLIFGILISYHFFTKGASDILIGIKYGLWWMLILLSATGIGFFLKAEKKPERSKYNRIKWSLVTIIILGRLWQLGKLFFPDFFFSFGYGKLDNFHFGSNPPIYYLTGFEGNLRRQGLFSGPNNYGYFLVAFLPLLLFFFPISNLRNYKQRKKSERMNLGIIAIWIITLLATLSRTAIVGGILVLLSVNLKFLRSHKKRAYSLGGICLLAILGLSLLKWESTLGHITAKFGGLLEVVYHPFGHGLGSSGPAVHHNGKFLPENYYLQLIIDLGSIGFLLWCGIIFLLQKKQKGISQTLTIQEKTEKEYQIFLALEKGFLILLVMGLFLHVFEDSMVNYLFFISYGIAFGYLSRLVYLHKNDIDNKKNRQNISSN